MAATDAASRHRLMLLAIGGVAVAVLIGVLLRSCDGGAEPDNDGAASTSTTTVASSSTSETTTTMAPTTELPPTSAATTAPPSGAAVELRQGSTAERAVALTFDAGSDAGYASSILDELAREGIRASFGITGDWARANPQLVARIAREGHLLLNHTDNHRSFTGASTGEAPLDAAERRAEIAGAAEAIAAAGGGPVAPWFRPPYGDSDGSVLRDVGAAGYRWSVLWTIDSLGWKGIPADQIVERCAEGASPGAIYLFHVGAASRDAEALASIVAELRAGGYAFVRVDQLV